MTMASITRYEIKVPFPMVVQVCIECANYFAVTEGFDDLRNEDGECFYCPAGHRQHYVTKEEREREEQQKFSTKDYADNAVLKSQVEYLSKRLKEVELALSKAKGDRRNPRKQAKEDGKSMNS